MMLTYLNLGHGGRVGNQMFGVSGVLGLASRFSHNVAFPYWMNHEHRERFGSAEDIDIQSWFKNKLPLLPDPSPNFRDILIEFNADPDANLPLETGEHGQNYNITQQWSGHLQSEKWFSHCPDLIRHYFEFDENKILQHAYNIEFINKEMPLYSAIHMRFGDYQKPDSWQPVLDAYYYIKAINEFPAGTKFFVFSDDPYKASDLVYEITKEIGSRNMINVSVPQHYIVHLYMMSICEHCIIGNSTFSWWGAWLNKNPDKKVVAPSTWWKPHIQAQWGYSTRHLFPKDWIII